MHYIFLSINMEENGEFQLRISALDDDLSDVNEEDSKDEQSSPDYHRS